MTCQNCKGIQFCTGTKGISKENAEAFLESYRESYLQGKVSAEEYEKFVKAVLEDVEPKNAFDELARVYRFALTRE